jgi:hypothetical protein
MTGDFEMFFISGIFMVASATVLIVWNATILTSVVSFLGQTFSRWLPAVKTAVAYPLASRGRTGMTIAMFSLIIFSLVMMATMNQNFVALFTGDDAVIERGSRAAQPHRLSRNRDVTAVGAIGAERRGRTRLEAPDDGGAG